MRKVWIEVALNGAWSRKLQPRHSRHGRGDRRRGHRLRAGRRRDRAHARLPATARRPSTGRSMPASSRASAPRSTCRSILPIRRSSAGMTATSRALRPCRGAGRAWPAGIRRDRSRQRQFHHWPTTTADAEAGLDLSQSRGACAPRAGLRGAARLPSGLRHLRAGLHAGRRGARARHRRQDADLPLHVLARRFAFGFPPKPYALAAHRRAAGGAGATRAVDDRRPLASMSGR